jgi:hypothetical protein
MKDFVNYKDDCHSGDDYIGKDNIGGSKYILVQNTQGGSILLKS